MAAILENIVMHDFIYFVPTWILQMDIWKSQVCVINIFIFMKKKKNLIFKDFCQVIGFNLFEPTKKHMFVNRMFEHHQKNFSLISSCKAQSGFLQEQNRNQTPTCVLQEPLTGPKHSNLHYVNFFGFEKVMGNLKTALI